MYSLNTMFILDCHPAPARLKNATMARSMRIETGCLPVRRSSGFFFIGLKARHGVLQLGDARVQFHQFALDGDEDGFKLVQ